MLWSELPQEYRDLEKGFDKKECDFDELEDSILYKFYWDNTPQKDDFWNLCDDAKTIEELPPIPQTN